VSPPDRQRHPLRLCVISLCLLLSLWHAVWLADAVVAECGGGGRVQRSGSAHSTSRSDWGYAPSVTGPPLHGLTERGAVADEQNVSRRRALLVLLLEHELERQTVWHNPQAAASLPFAAGMAFSSEYILAPVRSRSLSLSLSVADRAAGGVAGACGGGVGVEPAARRASHAAHRRGGRAGRRRAGTQSLSISLSPCTPHPQA
jgi:hypothetical protein